MKSLSIVGNLMTSKEGFE